MRSMSWLPYDGPSEQKCRTSSRSSPARRSSPTSGSAVPAPRRSRAPAAALAVSSVAASATASSVRLARPATASGCQLAQRRDHGGRLAGDPAVGEAQRRQAGSPEQLVALVVALEGPRVQVRGGAVGLDDGLQLRPVEVDLEAGDGDVDERPWQPRLRDQFEEALLQVAAGDLRAGVGEG